MNVNVVNLISIYKTYVLTLKISIKTSTKTLDAFHLLKEQVKLENVNNATNYAFPDKLSIITNKPT